MNRSESIKNLAAALSLFQGEVQNPKNTANNPYFNSKYAPLDAVINAIKPALSKHGLSYIQAPSTDGDKITITTMILHSSGEWIESEPLTLKAERVTAQGAGSAITYARRYALCAMLGISGEDDDDGNGASKAEQTDKSKVSSNKNEPDSDCITQVQQKKLFAIAGKDNAKIVKDVLLRHKYYETKQVKKVDFDVICKEIEAEVKALNGGQA